MATNINIATHNCCQDFSGAYGYTIDHSNGLLTKRNLSDGAISVSYPLDTYITEVYTLYFDGIFFWTLEPVFQGMVIRRWYISSSLLKLDKTFSYASTSELSYDSNSFAVVHNTSQLSQSVAIGDASLFVSSAAEFSVGDSIYVGISSDTDTYELFTISGIDTDADRLDLNRSTTASFTSDDYVVRLDELWVMNNHAPFLNSEAAIIVLDPEYGNLTEYSMGGYFRDVEAVSYYDGSVILVNGNSVLFIDKDTKYITSIMYIDNLDTDRANRLPIYSVFIKSNLLYRLQHARVYYNVDQWDKEDWGSKYNFVTDSIVPELYFVELFAAPDLIHKKTSEVTDPTSNILVRALTQFRVPITGKTVSLSSDQGSFSPSVGVTDTDGEFSSTYNGNTQEALVSLTASIT